MLSDPDVSTIRDIQNTLSTKTPTAFIKCLHQVAQIGLKSEQEKLKKEHEKQKKILKKKQARIQKKFKQKKKRLEEMSQANNNLRLQAETTKSLAFKDSKAIYDELKSEKEKNLAMSNEIERLKELLKKVQAERDYAVKTLERFQRPKFAL